MGQQQHHPGHHRYGPQSGPQGPPGTHRPGRVGVVGPRPGQDPYYQVGLPFLQ